MSFSLHRAGSCKQRPPLRSRNRSGADHAARPVRHGIEGPLGRGAPGTAGSIWMPGSRWPMPRAISALLRWTTSSRSWSLETLPRSQGVH